LQESQGQGKEGIKWIEGGVKFAVKGPEEGWGGGNKEKASKRKNSSREIESEFHVRGGLYGRDKYSKEFKVLRKILKWGKTPSKRPSISSQTRNTEKANHLSGEAP